MKTTFSATVQVLDKEILEAEVIEVMRAYAKNIARDVIRDEIQQDMRTECERLAKAHAETLKNTYWHNKEADVNKILKEAINSAVTDKIIKDLNGYNALASIKETYDNLIKVECDRAKALVDKYFKENNIIDCIEKTIKEVTLKFFGSIFNSSIFDGKK